MRISRMGCLRLRRRWSGIAGLMIYPGYDQHRRAHRSECRAVGTGGVWNGTSLNGLLRRINSSSCANTDRSGRPRYPGYHASAASARVASPRRSSGRHQYGVVGSGGRGCGQPVYELLGAERLNTRLRQHSDAERLPTGEFGEQLVAQGYHAIKLHTWCIPEQDVELARVMRHEFGDRVELMLDAENNYDHESALRVHTHWQI